MKNNKAPKIIAGIFSGLFRYAPFSSALSALHSILGQAMPAIETVVTVGLFDGALKALNGEDTGGSLVFYAAVYLVAYFINDVLAFVGDTATNTGVFEKGSHLFRIKLYEKMAKMPLIAFEDAGLLNNKERAEKAVNDNVMAEVFKQCLIFAGSAVSIVGVVAVLASFSLWLVPVSLLSVAPHFISRLLRGREFYRVKYAQAKKTRLLTYLWNLFNGRRTAKEMRVMGFDGYITGKWARLRDEVNEETWKVNLKDVKSMLFCDAICIVGYGLSVIIVLLLAINGDVSVGVLGASLNAFAKVQANMREFLISFGKLPENLSYARDYFGFLDLPEEQNGHMQYGGLKSGIKARNVSFKYPNAAGYAVRNVSLDIQRGEKIAVLGENGSGKTTLSKLLLGLYPQESGEVLYDGADVRGFSKESFFKNVSVISQNFVSYNLTLRENVAISDTRRMGSDDEITAALRGVGLAYITDEVGGLDGVLGREFGGSELSGGEWQKLAIARGLFRASELIILDEPTSALDPLIETEILTKFLEIAKDKTAVIISHRVGLSKLVDKIVVMKDGEVAETGTHADLMRRDGEYARLYLSQEQWYSQ
ncbi:MAG: ABC transporter ATP-binding protein/permease [Oscillospiraceae bacterium]|jgi:ABC-type multidrug transport system fused ATPase/permease subunit|nr:ABC transporter ATP-binding protein/permease [Oscillospiraceae bacterium]